MPKRVSTTSTRRAVGGATAAAMAVGAIAGDGDGDAEVGAAPAAGDVAAIAATVNAARRRRPRAVQEVAVVELELAVRIVDDGGDRRLHGRGRLLREIAAGIDEPQRPHAGGVGGCHLDGDQRAEAVAGDGEALHAE